MARPGRTPLDRAYDALDALLVRRHLEGSIPGLDADIDYAWQCLRTLQDEVLAAGYRELEASFELSTEELRGLLYEARAALAEDE